LAAADQVAPVSHTAVILTYEAPDPEYAIRRWREGVQELCRQLPWVSGCFYRADQGYSHLAWRDDGQAFFERLDGSKLPTYKQLKATGAKLHELDFDFRPTGMTTREAEKTSIEDPAPALLVSGTTIEGGLIITFATHHHLCDGTQAILYGMVGEIVSGRPQLHLRDNLQPLKRYDLINKSLGLDDPERPKGKLHGEVTLEDYPAEVRRMVLGANGKTKPAAIPVEDQSTGKGNYLKNEIFAFPTANLKQARAALGQPNGKGKPSTVLFLIALFWALITEVREKRGSTVASTADTEDGTVPAARTSVIFPVSARPVFAKVAQLDESKYIGNLISGGVANTECANLTVGPSEPGKLPQSLITALKLVSTSAFTSMNAEWIKARLNLVLQVPDARILVKGGVMGSNDLLATSWSHLDLYPDFGPGIGRCQFMRPSTSKLARTNRAWFSYLIMLAPRVTAEGVEVLEVFTCFDADDMAALKRHPLLRALLTVQPSSPSARL